MTEPVYVEVGDRKLTAFHGDRLLDALLLAGVEVASDCRAGPCTLCPVRILAGRVVGGETAVAGEVMACRARLAGHVRLELPGAAASAPAGQPSARTSTAMVSALLDLTADVVEVELALTSPFTWKAGQFANVTFAGYETRAMSPTVALDGSDRPASLRLQVARVPGGHVSSALGREIGVGHRVVLEGPFGEPALGRGDAGRLLLFSSGTGFAPMWALADAALRENAGREVVVVAGVRALEGLYMAEALERMSRCANVTIVPLTHEPQGLTPIIRTGTPRDYAYLIRPGDSVHAAGPADLVAHLAATATAAGAAFRADPFSPGMTPDDVWLGEVARRFAGRPDMTATR